MVGKTLRTVAQLQTEPVPFAGGVDNIKRQRVLPHSQAGGIGHNMKRDAGATTLTRVRDPPSVDMNCREMQQTYGPQHAIPLMQRGTPVSRWSCSEAKSPWGVDRAHAVIF